MGANGKHARGGKTPSLSNIAKVQSDKAQGKPLKYVTPSGGGNTSLVGGNGVPNKFREHFSTFGQVWGDVGEIPAIPEVPAWKQKILDARAQRAAAAASAVTAKTAAVAAPKTDDLALGGTTSVLG